MPKNRLRDWVRSTEHSSPEEQWVLLCFLAGQSVTVDMAELHAALRRSELLLAAGGDPRRPLELYGRAVTALAEDLDDPSCGRSWRPASRHCSPRSKGSAAPPRPYASSAATAIWPGSATPCHSSPSISPTRSDTRSL